MFELFLIAIVAFGASLLTFFSGFGLGTMLTPVFILFLPVELAIAATAIVHFLNNLFKLVLIGRYAVLNVILKFGIPAILGAYIGAHTLGLLSDLDQTITFSIVETSLLNVVLGTLILFFALFELLPRLKSFTFPTQWLIPGGVLSGFFGGLSGHQGALRSAFLIRLGLSKERFVASGIVIACLIDSIRISTYASTFDVSRLTPFIDSMFIATAAAFAGAIIGKRLLKKVTISFLQTIVGILMIIISFLLFLGWV